MKTLLYILFSLFAYSYASIADCGAGQSTFQITELSLTPDPPVIGKQVDLILKFNNPGDEIFDGSATTYVTINGIPYPSSKNPLCENTSCPIKYGYNDRSTSTQWPELSGKIDTKVEWKDTQGNLLLCIHSTVKVYSESYLHGTT